MRCRTPPLLVLSASADGRELYGSYDDESCSVHELSGGGSGSGCHSNGSTPRGQHAFSSAAALPVFHRTAPAAVSSGGSGGLAASAGAGTAHLASSAASLVTSVGAASSMGSVSVSASSSSLLGASAPAPASVPATLSVITPLPRSAIQKSSLYELRAAFQELSRALAEMEVAATKRARVRSEAYIIKFEHEYADLARVKDRAMKRLEALLRAGPGGTPAFAPDSVHAQALGGVLRAVLDIDDELLLLMGTEHGTWEELKRVRGEIQRHLLLLARELGGEAGEGSYDPLSPVPMVRSLSSPCAGAGPGPSPGPTAIGGGSGCGGGSVFSFAPAAVAASGASRTKGSSSGGGSHSHSHSHSHSKRKTAVAGAGSARSGSPSEEDVFKLRPLEASLSSLGSSGPLPGGSSSGGSIGKDGLVPVAAVSTAAPHQQQPLQQQPQRQQPPQQQQPRRPAQLHQPQHQPQGPAAEGRDPESPGTMTTASLASSSSSAFSQLSECASDEERSIGGGSGGSSKHTSKGAASASDSSTSAAPAGAYNRLPAPSAMAMNKSVSSDALSGLLNPLPAALTARVREKASFLHHRTLGGSAGAPMTTNGNGGAPARPRYHTTVKAPGSGAGSAAAAAAAAAVAGRLVASGGGSGGAPMPRVARPVEAAAAKS
jgi:hypothetical protein